MRDSSRLFLGVMLILVGAIFLLRHMGLLDFSVWQSIWKFWPVVLILLGISMMLRRGWLAAAVIVALIVMGGIFLSETHVATVANERHVVQNVAAEPGVSAADIVLHYGAGELMLSSGNTSSILYNKVTTSDLDDPKITYDKRNGTAQLSVERSGSGITVGESRKDTWALALSPVLSYNMDINYGAANVNLDLRNLNITRLNINGGATSSVITFGEYPVSARIDTGASSFVLRFPENASAVITFEGGLASGDFNGFVKDGNSYYSRNYDSKKQSIRVDVHAGASSVKSELYR